MYVATAVAAAELLTCSSDPPDAKKSPAREKATAVAGPCHTTPHHNNYNYDNVPDAK